VFKRNVDEMVVKELFGAVENTVRLDDIEFIFSLVNQQDIYNLFSSLGFTEVNKEDVYIEEVNFEKSKFKDTKLMLKKI
jgi:N-acetylglutamate synthase-like GNAT family acetyltransferase